MSTNSFIRTDTLSSNVQQNRTKEIIFSIRRLVQASELYTKELNKKYQVSAAQLNCILTLYDNGPLLSSQIAKHMMVKSSTVTGVVDRLENKGLVERLRNSHDRRMITIQLTEAGKKLAENAPPPIQQRVKNLTEVKKDQIVASLNMLTSMLDVRNLEVD
ncbi:MAG: MarR family transcriptional regulator [Desulfobacterales bacterium]|nr:MarR family transcriptional regulator [Desulfobacterales bacterium]